MKRVVKRVGLWVDERVDERVEMWVGYLETISAVLMADNWALRSVAQRAADWVDRTVGLKAE